MTEKIYSPDVVIVGGGVAGLTVALNLAPRRVCVITKNNLGVNTSSSWSQAGIAASIDKDDSNEKHLDDTLKTAKGLANKEVVEKIVEVPVEKIVEKEVIVEKIVEVPKGPTEPEKLAEAMSLVHKGQMLPEEKSELAKLKEEFGQFRKLVNLQLASLGGGGSTRILDNDDVDISSLGNGKFLKYNSTTGKLEFTDEVGTYTFS